MIVNFLRKFKIAAPHWFVLPLWLVYLRAIEVWNITRGYYVAKKLIKQDNTLYVITHLHIGDMCYVLAFLGEYRKRTGKKVILNISKTNRRALAYYDKCYDDVLLLSDKDNRALMLALWELRGQPFIARDDIVGANPNVYDNRVIGLPYVNVLNFMREVIFKLPHDIEPVLPRFVEYDNPKIRVFKSHSRKVIICPYSLSVENLRIEFWEKLVEYLTCSGYKIYCNIVGTQKPINGTETLNCSLDELPTYANNADYFIGIRSGILDFLISCKCKFIVVYGNNVWAKQYCLAAWGCNPYVYEQYGEPNVEKIMEYIEQTKDL